MSRLDRITSDPEICHGQPAIRGLRYPVEDNLRAIESALEEARFVEISTNHLIVHPSVRGNG